MPGAFTPERIICLFIVFALSLSLAKAQETETPFRMRTVVIDPGHGGHDPGNLGTGKYKTREKDIALDVALRVGGFITEMFPDIKVLYTRDTDVFIGLNERADVANKANADLFLSIHCNAAQSPDAYGAETFTLGLHKNDENLQVAMKENQAIFLEDDYQTKYEGFDPRSPESIIALTIMQSTFLEQSLRISSYVQKQFKEKIGRKDRGVKQAGFLVLRRTTMPSILIELGFLTNKDEENFLNSVNGRVVMASAIFRGFKEYKERLEGNGGSVPDEKPKPVTPAPQTQKESAKPTPVAAEKDAKQKELEAALAEKQRLEKLKQEQDLAAQKKAREEQKRKEEEVQRLAKEKAAKEKELEEARKKADAEEKAKMAEQVEREAVAEQARTEFAERLAAREKARQDSVEQVHARQREEKLKEVESPKQKETVVPETKDVVPELADKPLTPEEAELLFLEKRKQELEARIAKIKGAAVEEVKTEEPLPKKEPQAEQPKPVVAKSEGGIVLAVQILTSATAIDVNSPRFKGEKADQYEQGGLYKYTVGNSTSFEEVTKEQTRLRKLGFEGAFVVAFKNGERITVAEARTSLKQ